MGRLCGGSGGGGGQVKNGGASWAAKATARLAEEWDLGWTWD